MVAPDKATLPPENTPMPNSPFALVPIDRPPDEPAPGAVSTTAFCSTRRAWPPTVRVNKRMGPCEVSNTTRLPFLATSAQPAPGVAGTSIVVSLATTASCASRITELVIMPGPIVVWACACAPRALSAASPMQCLTSGLPRRVGDGRGGRTPAC